MARRLPLEPGAVVSGGGQSYVIQRLLSRSGGSALTYYAARSSDRQLVVLKELYPQRLAGRGLVRAADGEHLSAPTASAPLRIWNAHVSAFRQEADRLLAFQEQHAQQILPGSDARLAPEYTFASSEPFEANGTWYMAVNTGEGQCLCEAAPENILGALNLLTGLCRALEALHGMGYLHLDVKPDNIFLTPSGQVRLLDFGSMLRMGSQPLFRSYSPGFSAPEVQPDGEPVPPTPGADVYSIAAVFYWMLFGRPLADEEAPYTAELNPQQLDADDFPPMLEGYSLAAIDGALELLRSGLAFHPEYRFDNPAVLRAALESLRAICLRDGEAASPETSPDAFIERVIDVHAFSAGMPAGCGECLAAGGTCSDPGLMCRLTQRYIEEHISPQLSQIQKRTCPRACVNAVERLLFRRGEYERSLFCLRFLESRAPIVLWDAAVANDLFNLCISCCINMDRSALRQEYEQRLELQRIPLRQRDQQRLKQAIWACAACEERFDFDAMVQVKLDFIADEWSGDDAISAILEQEIVEQELAEQAGQLAEALCLQRAPGWQHRAGDILAHILNSLEPQCDDTFLWRSVDNALHYAIEIGDGALFLKTLEYLPGAHPLALPSDAPDSKTWIAAASNRFVRMILPGDDAFAMYLLLKSINLLFPDALESADVRRALTDMVQHTDLRDLSGHPVELIHKHLAMLNARLGRASAAMEAIGRLRSFLLNRQEVSILRLIAEAALLDACRFTGQEAGIRNARTMLVHDIEDGIQRGLFSTAHFDGVLSDGDGAALLDKFRFKHR